MVILPFYLECNVLWQLIHSVQLTHLNELRFSNNFVEKRSSSFLKALRNQDFLSRTLLCIGLKSLKLQNEYFYDSA